MSKAKDLYNQLSIIITEESIIPTIDIKQEEWEDATWWDEQSKIFEADPSLQPPKEWWDEMIRKGKSSDLIGWIWYHKLNDIKRSEIRKRYGKIYAPAG